MREYSELRLEELHPDPMVQFDLWFQQARAAAGLIYPETFCLGTVSPAGEPEGRMVLLKQYDDAGFVFFTNYTSPKSRALASGGLAAMTFYWEPLARQVRVQGSAERVDEQYSDRYFRTRPRASQLAAWASRQSEPLPSTDVLTTEIQRLNAQFPSEAPRPPHWGGWRISPRRIELWQERANRLHDRYCYTRNDGIWKITRLFP